MTWWDPKFWRKGPAGAGMPAEFDKYVRDNFRVLKTQIADDGLVQVGSYDDFSGLLLRTHPEIDRAPLEVNLVHADEILLNDGYRLRNINDLTADISVQGVGGIDAATPSPVPTHWYSVFVVRNPSTKEVKLICHPSLSYFLDQSMATTSGASTLRATSGSNVRIAQGFKVATIGGAPIDFVDVRITRIGAPVGRVWLTIEGDASGSPDGTPLATSDKLNAATLSTNVSWIRCPFRVPHTPTSAATQYHLVMYGDYTFSAVNAVTWSGHSNIYANGVGKVWNGTTWETSGLADYTFKLWLRTNNTGLQLYAQDAGFTQSCRVGFFYVNSSSFLEPAICFNRKIIPLLFKTAYAATPTEPTLVDLSAMLPPVPCFWWPGVYNASAGSDSRISPVPDGYGTGNTRVGGAIRIVFPPAGFVMEVNAPVHVLYQSIYAYANVGLLSLNSGIMEW
jgi:hypothetical protein